MIPKEIFHFPVRENTLPPGCFLETDLDKQSRNVIINRNI